MATKKGSPTFAKKLGARVRALRLEQDGLTQEQFAWDCDLDKGYVSQVESGKRLPSLPVLSMMADRLGVRLVDLVGFDMSDDSLALLDALRRADDAGIKRAGAALGLSISRVEASRSRRSR